MPGTRLLLAIIHLPQVLVADMISPVYLVRELPHSHHGREGSIHETPATISRLDKCSPIYQWIALKGDAFWCIQMILAMRLPVPFVNEPFVTEETELDAFVVC